MHEFEESKSEGELHGVTCLHCKVATLLESLQLCVELLVYHLASVYLVQMGLLHQLQANQDATLYLLA